MKLEQNWYEIGNKTCYTPKVSTFSTEIGQLCQQVSKCHFSMQARILQTKI